MSENVELDDTLMTPPDEESSGDESSNEPVDPWLGRTLEDRYKVQRKLGEGGMGAVYAGEHLLIKRPVAIKFLHSKIAHDPEAVERFHREALAATAIGHPNIIEVTDMGRVDDGTVFMVLELLDGRPWSDDIAEQGAQPLDKVLHIALQICDALGAAHEKNIIHRDLKPENIFLCKRGRDETFAKLLDFGIAKIRDADFVGKGITKTGNTLGTPFYMSPEQLEGRSDLDARSDIFTLGGVLFEALTGHVPFKAPSLPALVSKICHEPAPHLSEYRPDLPRELEALLDWMLQKKRDDRPTDCATVIKALEPFQGRDDDPSRAVVPSPQQAPSPEQSVADPVHPNKNRPVSDRRVSTEMVEPPRWSKSKNLALIAGVVFTLSLLSGIALLMNGRATPVAPSRPAERATATENTAEEAAKTVTLVVTTDPPRAALYLDGEGVDNPYAAELAIDDETHHVEATLDGYEPLKRAISLQKAQRLALRLTPIEPEAIIEPATKTGPRQPRSAKAGGRATKARAAVEEPLDAADERPTKTVEGPPPEHSETKAPPEQLPSNDEPTNVEPADEERPTKQGIFKRVDI